MAFGLPDKRLVVIGSTERPIALTVAMLIVSRQSIRRQVDE